MSHLSYRGLGDFQKQENRKVLITKVFIVFCFFSLIFVIYYKTTSCNIAMNKVYQIKFYQNNLCFDIQEDLLSNHSLNVVLNPCNGQNSQKWIFIRAFYKSYLLKNIKYGKVITRGEAEIFKDNNSNIQSKFIVDRQKNYNDNSQFSQIFFVRTQNNYCGLANLTHLKCLEIFENIANQEYNLIENICDNNVPNQQFIFIH